MSLELAAPPKKYIWKCIFVFIQDEIKCKNVVEENQVLPSAPAHNLDIPSRGSHCFMIFKRIKPSFPLQQGALAVSTDPECSDYFESWKEARGCSVQGGALWAVCAEAPQEKTARGTWRGSSTALSIKCCRSVCMCVGKQPRHCKIHWDLPQMGKNWERKGKRVFDVLVERITLYILLEMSSTNIACLLPYVCS